jgi:uncharacterized damage-inducible protein DinB
MKNVEYFQTLARYNHWMNQKMFAICSQMSDEERKLDRGAPFKSISGTLNHLLVTDRMWLGRFYANPFVVPSLDYELYADYEELDRERQITDAAISNWVNSLSDEDLLEDLTFTAFSTPTEYTLPLWVCALHLFNHQTHHRGQLTTLIEQAGYDCGVTDLGAMARS